MKKTSWITALGTLMTAAVTFGVLDSTQADATTNVIAALATFITATTGALHAFGVVRTGEPQVTPIADPRDENGAPLTSDRR